MGASHPPSWSHCPVLVENHRHKLKALLEIEAQSNRTSAGTLGIRLRAGPRFILEQGRQRKSNDHLHLNVSYDALNISRRELDWCSWYKACSFESSSWHKHHPVQSTAVGLSRVGDAARLLLRRLYFWGGSTLGGGVPVHFWRSDDHELSEVRREALERGEVVFRDLPRRFVRNLP